MLCWMQPLQPAYEAIMDASDELGRTLHNLLAGDERGHVPEQLTELDTAVETLTAARCVVRNACGLLSLQRRVHLSGRAAGCRLRCQRQGMAHSLHLVPTASKTACSLNY